MKRLITVVTLLMLLILSVLFMLPAGAGEKIGYYNIESVLMNSIVGKDTGEKLKSIYQDRKNQIADMEKDLQRRKDELEKQRPVLTEKALGKKELDYKDRFIKYQELVKQANEEIQKPRQSFLDDNVPKVLAIVEDIKRKEAYSNIIEISKEGKKPSNYKHEQDITVRVTQRFNSEIASNKSSPQTTVKKNVPISPPNLSATLAFSEPSGNNILDAGEMGKLIITVKNSGKGDAFDVTGEIQAGSSRSALAFDRTISFGTIAAGAEVKREISIQAKEETPTADAALTVELKEANGFDAQPLRVAFKVKAFVPPQLVVADMGINDQSGNSRIEPMEMVEVTARIQNIGHGDARNVTVDVETGANVFLAGDSDSRSHFEIGGLPAGKFQDVKFTFYTNTRIKNGEQIPLTLRLREARPQFNASHPLQLAMNAPAKGTQDFVVTAKDAKQEDIHLATGLSVDVDSRIPEGKKAMENDVAVIIGNRHYTARGVPEVAYADRDAKIMREYMIQTFGFKTDNVIYEENATLSKFNELFGTVDKPKGKVFNWMKKGANLFIYYVGHGAPDLETQDAYFVPVDANPQYIATNGYRLQTFYANLGKIQAKKITVVIDACFSGNSDRGFLFKEISPALVKVKTGYRGPQNALVMTSAAEDQVSSWYKDKRHSLFTYYFLKGIQGEADVNSDGRITVGEMKAYLTENVPHMARRLNNVEQHPVIVGNDQEILVSLKK